MQWDKVKNLLIVVLCAINLFLAGMIGVRMYDAYQQERNLLADISVILARFDLTSGPALRMPPDQRLITLEAERERAAEEAVAKALLGEEVQAQYHENGEVSYGEGESFVVWTADGGIDAVFYTEDWPEGNGNALKNYAKRLFSACGITVSDKLLEVDDEQRTAVLHGAFSGVSVYGMELTLKYEGAGQARLTGKWCLGEPYALAADRSRVYSASDALMQFIEQIPQTGLEITQIDALELGYGMSVSSAGRMQMAPVWKINTDKGSFLFDSLKNSIENDGNMV